MTNIFRSWLRPDFGEPWEQLCFSDDPDRGDAELMCRELATELFNERSAKGHFIAVRASLVTLPGSVRPYGVGVRRKKQ